MTFWLIAAVIPLVTALVMFKPLLQRRSPFLGMGLALVALVPVTSLLLYQGVGEPRGSSVAGRSEPTEAPASGDMTQLLAELQARMETEPENLEGWLLLGRSYKSMQRFDEALQALEQAYRLAPDDPLVAVELAEALVFTGPQEFVDPRVTDLLQTALARDPEQQKGLWLAGMVAMQAGDNERATQYWKRLLAQLEPNSEVARSVQQQLDSLRSESEVPTSAWPGLQVTVEAPMLGAVPAGAVLFLVARDPAAPRPPLGAVRVASPVFPLEIPLGDVNSMMAQRQISSPGTIEVFARLSLDGQPIAREGDPESPPVTVSTKTDAVTRLVLTIESP